MQFRFVCNLSKIFAQFFFQRKIFEKWIRHIYDETDLVSFRNRRTELGIGVAKMMTRQMRRKSKDYRPIWGTQHTVSVKWNSQRKTNQSILLAICSAYRMIFEWSRIMIIKKVIRRNFDLRKEDWIERLMCVHECAAQTYFNHVLSEVSLLLSRLKLFYT